MKKIIVAMATLALLATGCAQMFTAKTTASYTKPDGTRIEYQSDKEQIGLDAEFDPATGKFHIKVDKAGTQEAVIAAVLQMNLKILALYEQIAAKLGPIATTAATAGS